MLAYQSMPDKAPSWRSPHQTRLLVPVDTHRGQNFSLFPFFGSLSPLFLGAHVLFTIGPDCWMGPSVRPLLIMWPLICLDSVTNRGCKERKARKHPSQSWGNWAQFHCKGSESSASTSQASSRHLWGSNENMISAVYWIIFQDSTVDYKISVDLKIFSRNMFPVNSLFFLSLFPFLCHLSRLSCLISSILTCSKSPPFFVTSLNCCYSCPSCQARWETKPAQWIATYETWNET